MVTVFLILLAFCFMLPWVLLLLPSSERRPATVLLFGAGLSIGALTLALYYVGSIWRGALQTPMVASVPLVCLALGAAAARGQIINWIKELWQEALHGLTDATTRLRKRDPATVVAIAGLVAIAASLILTAADALFYPFVDWDAVALYALMAKRIFEFGGMERFAVPAWHNGYETYPLLVPLSYVWAYLSSGRIDEHMAKLAVPGFAALNVGATYYAGSRLLSRRVGVIAAVVLAVTPMYASWSASGYTDVPAAFFFTMSWVLFVQSLRGDGGYRLAIAAGLMGGLALWSRAGAGYILVALPILACLRVAAEGRAKRWLLPRHAMLLLVALGTIAAVAGPWYVAGYLMRGSLIPQTAWTWAADRSWQNLFPFVGFWSVFGYLLAPVYALGLASGLWAWASTFGPKVGAARPSGMSDGGALVAVSVPYLLLWWYDYSYDARFLLMVLPALAVGAAWLLDDLFLKDVKSTAQLVLVVVALGLVAWPGLRSTGGMSAIKNVVLHSQWDDDARRADRDAGYEAFRVVQRLLDEIPASGRATMTDSRMAYFGDPRVVYQAPSSVQELEQYDFFVWCPWTEADYARKKIADVPAALRNPEIAVRVFEQEGYVVLRILPTP